MAFWAQPVIKVYKKRRLTKHLSSSICLRVSKLFFLILTLIVINSVGMVYFEGMKPPDAIWLSFTTITTVGYGDFSPSTLGGRLVTIFTMYGFAITILSLLAAEVIEWRLIKTDKKNKGYWEWKDMSDHIQIINTPSIDAERYLCRLVNEIHETPIFEGMPIQILTRKFSGGLPNSLEKLKVLHRSGAAEDGVILHKINLNLARYIIILARDATDSISDSVTFDILSQVMKINPNANVLVEAVLDENRDRFIEAGAQAVLRPVRAYPGMVVRSLCHPGTERVLENFFQAHGDSLQNFKCKLDGISWEDVVMTCIKNKFGTPVAYFNGRELSTQPDFDTLCVGDSLAILVREDSTLTDEQVSAALSK